MSVRNENISASHREMLCQFNENFKPLDVMEPDFFVPDTGIVRITSVHNQAASPECANLLLIQVQRL
ncbi:hypothetical protein GZ77_18305 [Endozoicomonas montiporae]|uniref:Uncharacterized protein n=1 Tax=Endozoicomonas montiporae TaxID=1027273 RepID=A0A081N201_9GAMM|nr:hypothetical protein GZ77_18305 [Endozoicomonas montiporae]